MNLGGKGFTSVAWLLGVGHEYDARAVVTDDLDADGRVDLIVVEDRWRDGQILHVYRNSCRRRTTGSASGCARRAPESRRWAAKVTVHTPAGKHVGVITCGDSIHAQHATTLHFGLGSQDRVDAIEVRWPNGKTRRIEKPAVDRYHRVSAISRRGWHSTQVSSRPLAAKLGGRPTQFGSKHGAHVLLVPEAGPLGDRVQRQIGLPQAGPAPGPIERARISSCTDRFMAA